MDLNSILNTGIDPKTGRYLTPEERKKAFKKSIGYASDTKRGSARDFFKSSSALVKRDDDKLTPKLNLLIDLATNLFDRRSERSRMEDKYRELKRKSDERDRKKSEEQSMESSGKNFGSKFLGKEANKTAKTIGFGLFNLLKGILAYGILDWISKPENKEAVMMMVKGLMGVFKVFSFFTDVAVSNTLGGFTKLFGGGSILERIFGFFQMLFGIFVFRRVLNPLKLLGDLKWVIKNLGNFRDIFKALSSKNLGKVADSVKKIFPKTASLFKKGLQGSIQRIFLKVFGKGITQFIKPIAKTVVKTVVRPLASVVKRIPIIGTLLGIPINMFLGDPIDKAAVKAIGATLGTFVVGALGSIIPGAGTVLGGIAGGLLGDWLAGWLYDGVIAPLGKNIQKAMPQLNTGGIASGPDSGYKVTLHGTEAVIPVGKLASTILEPYKTVASAVIGGTLAVLKSMGPIGAFMGPIALQMFNPFIRVFGFSASTFASGLGKGSELLIPSAAAMESGDAADYLSDDKDKDSTDKKKGDDIKDGTTPNEPAPAGPSSYSAIDWKKDPEFGNAVNKVAKYFNIRANDLMGLMASESGLSPTANNGTHVGLIQFSASAARGAGTSQSALLKMSRAEQMPYVQKYLENAGLPKGATAGHLYTAVFLPAFVKKPANFVIANKDGSLPSGYPESRSWYSSNRGLDMNNDGKLTISELGERVQKKKKEFGIPMAEGGRLVHKKNDTGFHRRERNQIVNSGFYRAKVLKGNEYKKYASGGSHRVIPDTSSTSWAAGIPLTYVKSKEGKRAEVAVPLAKRFQGFLNDLQSTGYKITELGGFRPDGPPAGNADGKGPQYAHPYGAAIDINWSKNPAFTGKPDKRYGDFPSNSGEISKKWGLGWGSKFDDAMHFSAMKREYGSGIGGVEISKKSLMGSKDGSDFTPSSGSDTASSVDSSSDTKEEKVDPGFMGSGASIEQLKYLMSNLGMKSGTGGAPPTPAAPPASSSLPSMSSNFTLDKKMSAITSKISDTVIVQHGTSSFNSVTVAPLAINNFGISDTDVLNKL